MIETIRGFCHTAVMRRRGEPLPVRFTLGVDKRCDLPGGYEISNFPSMLARRVLYYALSAGEMKWKTGGHYQHPLPGCPFHDDRGFLFHFVLSGELTHRANRQAFIAARNEAVLLDLRHPIEYCNAAVKPVHFLWIWFDGIGLEEICADLRLEEDPVFQGMNRPLVRGLFSRLVAALEHERPGYEVQLSALLGTLLAELCRARPLPPLLRRGHPSVALSPAVRKVVTAVARKYAKRWTIKELSQLSGLSMYYFFRMFRREMGYTPMQYLNRYRIEQAKMLLTATRMTIEEIARQVGIPNRTHFAEVFREVTGMSPRKFRLPSSRKRRP
jgi:AraC-like DNA-binding protein